MLHYFIILIYKDNKNACGVTVSVSGINLSVTICYLIFVQVLLRDTLKNVVS